MLWTYALGVCFGHMLYVCVLGVCFGHVFGRVFWACVLGVCLGVCFRRVFWGVCFGHMLWAYALSVCFGCMALEHMALGASLFCTWFWVYVFRRMDFAEETRSKGLNRQSQSVLKVIVI